MTPTARLVRMEIEAFRGFAVERILDLDADTVLVRGDNGTGKTSITDALLWLLTGDIPRLKERAKGMRKDEGDPIVNRYRLGEKARVSLTVRATNRNGGQAAQAQEIRFQRVGTSRQSALQAFRQEDSLDGQEAESLLASSLGHFTHPQLAHAVSGWGVLQQHALLAALEGGASMHERLAEMVGLERVNRFAKGAAEVVKAARADQREAEQVRDRLQGKRSVAESSLRGLREQQEPPESDAIRISRLVGKRVRTLPTGVALAQSVEELEQFPGLLIELDELFGLARALASAGKELQFIAEQGSEATEGLEGKIENLKEAADQAIARAPAQVQMADAALQLLSAECPVCGQQIDEDSVRQHLMEMTALAREESERVSGLRRELGEAEAFLQSARLAEARRIDAEKQVEFARGRLQNCIEDGKWIAVDSKWTDVDRAEGLTKTLEALESDIREVQGEARRTGNEQVLRYSTEVEAATKELAAAEADATTAKARTVKAVALDKAAHEAAERIVERALERLQPSLAEVFDRLSPHPTFAELKAKQDIYYGKNQVVPHAYDRNNKVGGHPALLFSEGQLNVVALSYFLGLALNAGEGSLPFIVLDDTLAAMDVVNVLGFADLCRRLRESRQLIVTTHDRRFAGLLARKLAPREMGSRTVRVELEGWTEDGPEVRCEDQPVAEVIPLPEQKAS
jgi:DNA repair exonuclease SbcCD ATPase subunit